MERQAISLGASRSGTRSCWRSRGRCWPLSTGSGRGAVTLRSGGVAVRDARDLGGPAADAPVRRLHAALGRRAGAADQRRGRGLMAVTRGMARYACAGLLGLLVVLAALSSGRQAVREYRAVAGLPAPPPGARNVVLIVWDTVRAAQPEPLRLSRGTPPPTWRGGRGRASGTTWPWRQPPGRTPRIAASSPASGLSSSIPSGIHARRPGSRPWPSTWPRGAIRPPGSRRTPAAAVTRPGWIGASPISRIIPLTPRSFLGRTVPGKLDPREHPQSRRFLRRQVDRPPIPRCARDQRRLPRLAAATAAGSPLLRLPELLRRPRARTCPRRDMRAVSGSGPGSRGITSSCFDYLGTGSRTRFRQRDLAMARDCYDDCIAFLDDQLGRLLDELRGQGLLDNTLVIITSDHGESFGDHRHLRPRHQPLPRRDRRPAGDPLPGRARGPRRDRPRQPARPAGHRGRPVGSLGRLTVPGPLAGGLLVLGTRTGTSGDHPSPLGARPTPIAFQTSDRAGPSRAGSRCPWWPRAGITSGTASGLEQLYDLSTRSVRTGQPRRTPRVASQVVGCLSEDAPRCADRQPRLDRGGKCLSEGLQTMAQIPR